MKNKHYLIFLLSTLGLSVDAQERPINIEVEAQAIGTTNDVVPFWMRSNQYGSIPSAGASGSLIGRINKDYDRAQPKKFDWGFGFEGRGNAGKDSRFILLEGYAKAKAGIFQLKAGRTKDVMGLNGDTTLSSGNFAVSGNALGVPKIEISIPEYWRVPILDGLFSIKGNFSHGWVGGERILDSIPDSHGNAIYKPENLYPKTYFHQKSLYVRLGKENWRVNLYGGVNHNVYWGAEEEIYGERYQLSFLETLFYVSTGKTYGKAGIYSKLGNQLGSVDLGIDYMVNDIRILLYRQFFYDVGAISKLANLRDGLTGLSFKNLNKDNKSLFKWKSFLIESFFSKNQAGEVWSKPTKSGDEDYYNNYQYQNGWSYNGLGLGTPLITSFVDGRTGLPRHPSHYFVNNRVIAFHLGANFTINEKNEFSSKITYSNNRGTYMTSIEGPDAYRKEPFDPIYGIFGIKNQFSFFMRAARQINNNSSFGIDVSLDTGKLLNNSTGLAFRYIRKF